MSDPEHKAISTLTEKALGYAVMGIAAAVAIFLLIAFIGFLIACTPSECLAMAAFLRR